MKRLKAIVSLLAKVVGFKNLRPFSHFITGVRALQFFNLVRFGVTILVMIALPKLGLSKEEIAPYELFWFLASLMSFFWVSGGTNALLSLFPKLESKQQSSIFFNICLLFISISGLAAGLLWGFSDFILHTFTNYTALPFLNLLCLFIFFNTPTWLVPLFYLLRKKHVAIIAYSSWSFGLQLIAVLLPIFYGFPLYFSFIGLVIIACIKWLWLLLLTVRNSRLSIDIQLIRTFSFIAFPLLLHNLIGSSVEYIDGFIVTSHFEEEGAFTLFRYGSKELPLVTLLVSALVAALLPEVSGNLEKGLPNIKQKTLKLAHVLFPASIFLMLISEWLFTNVVNPEFREAAIIFNVYLLILSSRILLPQVIIIAQQNNYFLVFSGVLELTTNVILSLIFVRFWGLPGIAFASVVAYLLNKIIMIFFLKTRFQINPSQYIPLNWYFFYNLLLFGTFWIVY